MAIIYSKEPEKEPKKFGFFFKISIIFLILGAVLHCMFLTGCSGEN